MYGFSKASAGRTQDVAGIASTQFPPHLAQQINRHMNAAHIAGYVGLGGPYSKKHFFDHYNKEWNLMTEEEMESISHYNMDSGADMLKELVTWCQRDVGIAKKAGYIDSVEATELHDRIVQFRAAMDGKSYAQHITKILLCELENMNIFLTSLILQVSMITLTSLHISFTFISCVSCPLSIYHFLQLIMHTRQVGE